MAYIEINNLKKYYKIYSGKFFKRTKKVVKAIDGINLKVEKGEFLGYIGPNGAGKSTTIKVLTGILKPDSGDVVVNGLSPHKDRKKYVQNIGAVFGQKTQMWWDLPVIETYKLLKSIYKIDAKDYKNHLEYLIERLDVKDFLNQPVRQLSLGQRMRAELISSMIHKPDILFLDEPTIGLDIVSKHKVLDFLKEVNSFGTTIFLTTHDLKDIEKLCQEIMILNKGKIIYKGHHSNLNDLTKIPSRLKIDIIDYRLNETQRKIIKNYKAEYISENKEIIIPIDGYKPGEVAKEFFQYFEIENFKVEEPGIEEVIKEYYS
ncbi:MAG: ABC transporter ATP-binding protein [Thermotogota bacterium]